MRESNSVEVYHLIQSDAEDAAIFVGDDPHHELAFAIYGEILKPRIAPSIVVEDSVDQRVAKEGNGVRAQRPKGCGTDELVDTGR